MTRPLFPRPVRTAAALTASGALLLGGSAVAAAGPMDAFTGSLATASSALGSSQPAETVTTGRFASVDNFRDVAGDGGDGYALPDGTHMQQGVFYRSNQLVGVSDEDMAKLNALGITTVYDLRTDGDIALPMVGGADEVPEGAGYVRLPIDSGNLMLDIAGNPDLGIEPKVTTPEEGRNYMEAMYVKFVENADSRAQFGTLLTDLAENDDPQVFHCTSGKDRTGWTAMLLQHIAGADDATILKDYLATNDYSATSIQKTLAGLENYGLDPDTVRPLLVVDESYLDAGLAAVEENYGSIDNYLTEGLGLDDDTIATLRDKLVA
ncbi:tyrosine-protein phosphatase [Tomitella gaofuii]|uniref:tyrosine-protein phosphatase n=1 Tax=Tomitella gaofuii TaxID=2760083 RepID=UPI0015FAFAFF|nr:tyrosine-protein phosphatase [Tomitella gaofuii]